MLLLATLALAQSQNEAPPPHPIEIDMEGASVDALVPKPELRLLADRKHAAFNPLVHLRDEFNAELAESVDIVK